MFSRLFNSASYYLNPYAIPVMLVGLVTFSIGFFVLRQNRKSVINIAFFYKCSAISLWLVTVSFVYLSRFQEVALIWYRYFTFLGIINIMPSAIFFATAWSGEFKRKKRFVALNYIIGFICYGLVIATDKLVSPYQMKKYFWGYYPVYKIWITPFLFFFFIQIFITVRNLYRAYKAEDIPVKIISKRMILFAALIGFTSSADFLPKLVNLPWLYPYGYITMFIYISLVAYSIVRYRAFDIETAAHKTIMWMLSFSFIVIPVIALYRGFFAKEPQMLQSVFWVVSFLLLAFYLRIIQPRIDHFFQRRSSNLEDISSRFAEELVYLKEIGQLTRRIRDIIMDTLYPQRVDIFIYSEDKINYRLAKETFRPKEVTQLKSAEEFLSWLAKNNKIVYREFIDIDPDFSLIKEQAKDYFKLTGTMVAVPLSLNESLLGIINLARKSNLKRFTGAEIRFLNTLKNQSTIAISNSLLYKNMEERVQERTHELVAVQKQLIHAEKLATVGTLAGGVAHEINNPLTAILTNVQMLMAPNGKINPEDKESLELIEEATKRCRIIVQKLMAYAKKPLEAAKVSTVNLLNVAKNMVSFLSYQFKQENIQLLIEAKDNDYPVTGNHNELEQVLTNMVLNSKDAIRQLKSGGDISILFSKTSDWVKLTVKDEGIGIPKEMMHKIFDPFFSTKDVGKGTGLGLSICQGIIEKHGGMITVQSEPYKGSAFTIQLPKAKTEAVLETV